jgi:hypothetical protein
VQPYYRAVNIKYIAVGNEVQGGGAQGSILPAMRNLRAALNAAGLGGIKVSTALRYDAFADTSPPSKGAFAQSYVYPYFAYKATRATSSSGTRRSSPARRPCATTG